MSIVPKVTPVGQTAACACPLPPRQPGLTKRRVIDLMRVGRTCCRR